MLGCNKMRRFVKLACIWGGLAPILLLGGCMRGSKTEPKEICPGKPSLEEALRTLESQVSQVKSLRASGQCRMGFFDQKGKKREYNLPGSLFLEPPSNLYLYAQPPVGPSGAVSMGSNQREFWLSVKPDINTLWWGSLDEASQVGDLRVSPGVVLEAVFALGAFDVVEAVVGKNRHP